MTPAQIRDRTIALYQSGRPVEALRLLEDALGGNPDEPALLTLKGQLLAAVQRRDEALICFDRVLAERPDTPNVLGERGALLSDMKRYDEALKSYDRAVALWPNYFEAFYNRGNALSELKRHQDALKSFERALAINPGFFPAWNNRGTALQALERYAEALESFDRALAIHAGAAETWNNRGYLLKRMGRSDEALASHERALALDPSSADAWLQRGNFLRDERHSAEALQSYDRALAIRPDDAQAWVNRGIVLRDMKRIPEALASHGKAIALRPDHAQTFYTRGLTAWVENQDYGAALADLEQAVRLDPDCPYALGTLLLVRQYGGDWRHFDADVAGIDARARAGKTVTEPFVYQAISGSPADLQACSAIHANHRYPAQTPRVRARRPGKIRIGYVSGEFREQATAYLMAGVYECHDKSRFEITAYDNGGSDNSPMRARLEAAFDAFIDISCLSDRAAAEKIAADGMDILVNLNGYFGDHRMGVFAHRAAPIQVNYLGFPATLGASYIDYILADRIVIPQDERRFYTEQVVYLPDSYQANDSRRAVAEIVPSRAECGLPENGFVFCNFNSSYKLTPSTFQSWMRILQQVPGSVLWLLAGNRHFSDNLRRQAEASDVAGTRILFAPVLPVAEHLARLGRADLFLDSLPYNGHTTASDALWAGVPLVTRRGTAFPGRVAASLLNAIGLAELVTENAGDYEAMAMKLAADAGLLRAMRERLARNRLTTPLFDTDRFRRHLEAAYQTMVERRARGLPAESFAVAPL